MNKTEFGEDVALLESDQDHGQEDLRLKGIFDERLQNYRENEIPAESVNSEELKVGDEASELVLITEDLIKFFGIASGDTNPAHMDNEFAKHTRFGGVVMHGVFALNIASKLLGTKLPGIGTKFEGIQDIQFLKPVKPGDELVVYVRVAEKREKGRVLFDIGAKINGENVLTAKALVIAPRATPK